MGKIVDARGLNCPQPVILTKKAMDEGTDDHITTIVDRDVAMENVTRLAANQGYKFEVEQKGTEYYINMNKNEQTAAEQVRLDGELVILVKSNLFGEGDNELGSILMRSFLYTLNELEADLKSIIFMNSGILLSIEDSPVLDQLKALEDKGIEILSCGTCLDFYLKTDKLAVGKVTNMYTASETMAGAARTITI